jgi:hypothetical protein
MKSRLRSKPLPLARVPATLPSGFWITLNSRTVWSRTASTSGSAPVRRRGELVERLEDRIDALVLVAVNGALDEERNLHVVPEGLETK